MRELRGFYDINQENLAKIRSAEEEAKVANAAKQLSREIDEVRVEMGDLKKQLEQV